MGTDLIAPIERALADKKLVSTFNANRFNDEVKWRRELEFALKIIRGNDQLQGCTPDSIRTAMLDVAFSGLSLSPSLGHAYLIPYRNMCSFHPGYKGIVHLCYKAGTLRSIQPGLHKELDPIWRVRTEGGVRSIVHEESDVPGRSSKPTLHAYVIAHYMNGGQHTEVMDSTALAACENAAKARNPKGGAVWRSAFRSQMEIKAVIRRASSYWPRDTGGILEHAMAVVDKHDGMDFGEPIVDEEPAELVINADQELELHAALTDRDLSGEEATRWLAMKAQALGLKSIKDLPARLFEKTRAELIQRLERVRSQSTTRTEQ